MASQNKYARVFKSEEIMRRSNVWNVPNTNKRLCHNHEVCGELASITCPNCLFQKYCSEECQDEAWATHESECVKYNPNPVHDIVGMEPGQPNYFKNSGKPRAWDRPNIFIHTENSINPMEAFKTFFRGEAMVLAERVKHFGDALFPKTMIILRNKKDFGDFFAMLKQDNDCGIGQDKFDSMVRVVNEATDLKERAAFLEEWKNPDSKFRVLINSPVDDDELVAPDVENVVVFEAENPDRSTTRWQRMARMLGQKGYYMTISPTEELLVHYHFGKLPPELQPGLWRPSAWKEDKHRIYENVVILKGMPKVLRPHATLDYLCDRVYKKEGHFVEGAFVYTGDEVL